MFLCYILAQNDPIFFMAVAYGSGQRILHLSDDIDDSGPGYGWSFLSKKGLNWG